MNTYKIVVASSGDFTLDMIDKILSCPNLKIDGVIPDPSVEEYNQQYRIALNKRNIDFCSYDDLDSIAPNLILSSEFRRLIPAKIVEKYFCLNLHGGILPKYRGICANAFAIMNGENEVGFTLHRTTFQMDAGAIYHIFKVPISYEQTYSDVRGKLGKLVLNEIANIILNILNGKLNTVPNEGVCVYCSKFHPDDGIITNWNVKSSELYNKWRCFAKPLGTGMYFIYKNIKYYADKWIEGKIYGIDDYIGFPGRITYIDKNGLYVKTADNVIVLQNISDENNNIISYSHFKIGTEL